MGCAFRAIATFKKTYILFLLKLSYVFFLKRKPFSHRVVFTRVNVECFDHIHRIFIYWRQLDEDVRQFNWIWCRWVGNTQLVSLKETPTVSVRMVHVSNQWQTEALALSKFITIFAIRSMHYNDTVEKFFNLIFVRNITIFCNIGS